VLRGQPLAPRHDNRRMLDWRHALSDPDARRGVRDMLPMAPGIAAWGVVTGVAMVQSGLGVPLSLFMSLVVYAGTAQLVALPLMASGAPMLVIWAAALCVNLRFVIYSAHWRPYFGRLSRVRRLALSYVAADVNYVLFQKAFPDPQPARGQLPYFIGSSVTLWLAWQLASIAGILLADVIPLAWGLGFAGTLAMLGLAYSLIQDRASLIVATVAGTAAVAAFALPLKLNIVVAIAAAVAAGLIVEQARRAAQRVGGG
jgi:predicted branched-subunit amino acid permease